MPCWRSSARCGKRSRLLYHHCQKYVHCSSKLLHNPHLLPRFLTDLELACKTKSFDVHKLVISSISQYFREILAKDPGMKRLELPSLSPLGMALSCNPSFQPIRTCYALLHHKTFFFILPSCHHLFVYLFIDCQSCC